jgi:hypothetical protein
MIFALIAAVSVSAVEIPDTPDGTVRAVAGALAERHPEVLWQALPPTYQRDIAELTHAFAAKMDPAVWDAAFGLGRRTAALLRDKKEIILASSMLDAAGQEREQIESGWDPMVALLDDVFSSDVSRLENLQTIDWGNYLATSGRDFMNLAAERSKASGDDAFDREFSSKLRLAEVELVSLDGDQATVRMTAPDEEPEDMQLVRVEGRWVPSDMARDWDQNVADAKQKLASITDEEIQQSSIQAMGLIGMADGVLGQLEMVETTEQFDQAMQGLLGPFLGGMGDEAVELEWTEEDSGDDADFD